MLGVVTASAGAESTPHGRAWAALWSLGRAVGQPSNVCRFSIFLFSFKILEIH
jgi:hypothetical protein